MRYGKHHHWAQWLSHWFYCCPYHFCCSRQDRKRAYIQVPIPTIYQRPSQVMRHSMCCRTQSCISLYLCILCQSHWCILEMVGFAFFVFFSRELFGTSSLGHPESISSVGTKKSCTHVWHGPFTVLVIKLCNREGGWSMVTSLYLVKFIRFGPKTQRFPCVSRY